MSSGNTNKTCISLQEHQDFFSSMAQDKRLRQDLQERPAEVLASFGIVLDRESLPANVELPDQESLVRLASTVKKPPMAPVNRWNGIFSDLEDMAEN